MILLTGTTGLVGSQLMLDLLLKNEKIISLKRKNSNLCTVSAVFNSHPDLYNKIEWVEGDVLDSRSLNEIFKRTIEKVYHCAGIVSFNRKDLRTMMKVNVQGTENIVNYCLSKGVKKLCYVSSVSAINRISENEIITEKTSWKDSKENSKYAISKFLAEQKVWQARERGLNFVIVNPTIIIGPGNWTTGSSAMFQQIWKGMKYHSRGTAGFVDVRDVSKAMINLMESNISGERFIINAENLTYKQVFSWIAEDLGRPVPSQEASKLLLNLAWRIAAAKQFLFGENSFITRETVISGSKKIQFSNEKIKNSILINFIPVRESVKFTSGVFLKEKKMNEPWEIN